MKTFRKNILTGAFALLFLPVFTACGGDEENVPEVSQIKAENTFTGTTTTWPSDNPEAKYVSTKSVYNFVIDAETRTANLTITDADFLEGMPALQPMTFPGISYAINQNVVIFNSPSLIPTIGGRPFSAFPITNLQAKLVTDRSLDLQFICNYRGTPYVVSFRGTPAELPD